MEFVNGKDDIPYMKWKITNIWNHQPDLYPSRGHLFIGNDKPGQPGRYFEDQPKHRFINGLTPRIGDLQTTFDPWKKKHVPFIFHQLKFPWYPH